MLSIVVPIYNGESYLDKFIENLNNQTFRNFELILVNDGSVDRTKIICENYKDKDSRIKVINKVNEGAGPARNAGIKVATGEYIMFIDCDDYFENNYLEILYSTISKNKVDLVICGQTDLIKTNNKKIKYNVVLPPKKQYSSKSEIQKDYIRLKEMGIADVLWNKIYSSTVIKNNNLTFPNLRRGQDAVFNINYFDKINSCITVNKALYYYRIDAFENIFCKFPKNHYEIINEENEQIEKVLRSWNVYDDASIYLNSHFIRAVFGSLINSFNPNWKFNFKQKHQYIKKIIEKDKVKKCCQVNIGLNLKEKIELFLIRKKYIVLLMIFLRIKILWQSIKSIICGGISASEK